MLHPAHIDGRSVVIPRRGHQGFDALGRGILDHDGPTLFLG